MNSIFRKLSLAGLTLIASVTITHAENDLEKPIADIAKEIVASGSLKSIDLCSNLRGRFMLIVANGYEGVVSSDKGTYRGIEDPTNFTGLMELRDSGHDTVYGTCQANRIMMIRVGSDFSQVYEGGVTVENGEIVFQGTFTHNRDGSYAWRAKVRDEVFTN